MRKFRVTTTVTKYYWADSREDASNFHEDRIRKGQLQLERDGKTDSFFCFNALEKMTEVPEDFSKTRDPHQKLRPGDWLEVGGASSAVSAIVRRVTRNRVHYLEASSMAQLSVSIEQWKRWADLFPLHPCYEETLPRVIVERVIAEHERRGLLSGMSAGGDSNLILDILHDYSYIPSDWEMENGYWAERVLEEAIDEEIQKNSEKSAVEISQGDRPEGESNGVSFSSSIPTIDDFKW
ncbi:MAG: hypothetical protein ACQKBT_00135 [Puniceicoccales bacterium]